MKHPKWLISFLVFGVLAPHVAASDSKGWHGESMPAGLEKMETEGEYRFVKDDSIMVYVPAGTFALGSEDGDSDEKPVRQIHLDAYYIDKYETSWRQWRLSGIESMTDINGGALSEDLPFWGRDDDLPVTYVNWHMAQEYAAWVGKRLPTEAEWEKAARGSDGRAYPWGNEEPTFERAVWKKHPIGKESPAKIDCCPDGASPYGAQNMAGNVFEWCQDIYDAKFYARAKERNPQNEEGSRYRVLRGAAFVLDKEDLRVALRNRQYAEEGQDYVGFRLVLPAR